MTDLDTIFPESFDISVLVLKLVHAFMSHHRIGSHELVMSASVMVAGAADLSETDRIQWIKEIADLGWIEPLLMNATRETIQEQLAELAAAKADDTRS